MVKGNYKNVFYGAMKKFINYPISLYNKFIQIFLTFVLPYAFINFYPAQLLLNKKDYIFHPALQYATLPLGVLLFIISYRFWLYGINRYQGTGS